MQHPTLAPLLKKESCLPTHSPLLDTTQGQPRFDVTLAGETNLDLILYGLPEQMPVDRELLATGFQTTLGGSSSILAHNLARLGSRVGFSTQLGQDDMGALALQRLREAALDLTHATLRPGKATGVTVILPHDLGRHILTHPGVMADMTAADLNLAYLRSSRHFHVSSLFLQTGLQPGLFSLFAELKAAGLTLSLDTNDDPEDRWAGVLPELLGIIDVLLPNEREVCKITRTATLDQALHALSSRPPIIAVKCGTGGALVQQGDARVRIAAPRVAPVDTIGAGDSFNAGFLHVYAQTRDPIAASRLGVVTGALSTLRPGGTEAFRDALLMRAFLAEHGHGLDQPNKAEPSQR